MEFTNLVYDIEKIPSSEDNATNSPANDIEKIPLDEDNATSSPVNDILRRVQSVKMLS